MKIIFSRLMLSLFYSK